MRIGIWGGCFNPPTAGHMMFAENALVELELDHILFVPVGVPSHKKLNGDPGPEVRYELVSAATAGRDNMSVSRVEIDRPGRSFMVDTLQLLAEQFPNDELWLMMGADEAMVFQNWHDPAGILQYARLGVSTRDDVTIEQLRAHFEELGWRDRVDFLATPIVTVSSTEIRGRIAAGLPIEFFAAPGTEAMIHELRLYNPPA
jgi:nicotinate-nucleotide adenylyltransferase